MEDERSRRGLSVGFTLLEVLITIFISAFGLLGLAAMQARMHMGEMEASQRAQATVLLRNISDRVNANRRNAMSYVTTTPLGGQPQECSDLSGAALDLCEWNNLLAGSAETQGARRIGAMVAARGCIANTDPVMPRKFTVAVVWQGLMPTVAPTSTDCGSGDYSDDRTRRAIVAPIVIGCLQNDINTGACLTP